MKKFKKWLENQEKVQNVMRGFFFERPEEVQQGSDSASGSVVGMESDHPYLKMVSDGLCGSAAARKLLFQKGDGLKG